VTGDPSKGSVFVVLLPKHIDVPKEAR
jgi:hypothetical protein